MLLHAYAFCVFVLLVNRARDCLMSATAMASLRPIRRLPTPLFDSISYRSRASTRCFAQSCRMRATVGLDALDASKGDRERIVILGSGWAGKLIVGPKRYPLLTNGTQAMSFPNISPPNTKPSSYLHDLISSSLPSSIPQQPVPSNFEPLLSPCARNGNQTLSSCKAGQTIWISGERWLPLKKV